MKFPKNLLGKNRSKNAHAVPGIRICLNCGSTVISINKKNIICSKCGCIKKFSSGLFGTEFKPGDQVKIVDAKNDPTVYKIKKMYLSKEGIVKYVLESKDNPIKLLYNENKESNLRKT